MSWASITSSSEVARNGLSYSPKICRTRSKPPPVYTSLYPDSSRKTFALEALPPTPQKTTTGLVLSAGRRDGSKNVHVDVSQVTFRAPTGPGLASTSPGPRTSMKVGSFNARRTASSAMTTGRKRRGDEDESVSVRLIDDFERRREDLGVATTYRARSAWKVCLSSSPRRTPSQIYASEQPGTRASRETNRDRVSM